MVEGGASGDLGLQAEPLAVAGAVLLVFVLSPMILCGNSLILTAVYRYKRLRTPSNYLIASLASSDLGIGLVLPFGLYFELTAESSSVSAFCFLPYCLVISLCCASVIVMSAIAVDRFTSLAQPLRYNNLITHTSVERREGLIGEWSKSISEKPGTGVLQAAWAFYSRAQPVTSKYCLLNAFQWDYYISMATLPRLSIVPQSQEAPDLQGDAIDALIDKPFSAIYLLEICEKHTPAQQFRELEVISRFDQSLASNLCVEDFRLLEISNELLDSQCKSNSLILTAVYRYKRLRNSEQLLYRFPSSSTLIGLVLPFGSIELTARALQLRLCFLPYLLVISLCCASPWTVYVAGTASALNNNTNTSVEGYIALFWLYAALVVSPLLYSQCILGSKTPRTCSFASFVDRPIQLFLSVWCTGLVRHTSRLLLLHLHSGQISCQSHLHVEVSLRQQQDGSHTRYGQTLAITVGLFIFLWTPFQACVLLDLFRWTSVSAKWIRVYLALPIFASSAVNPWVYGYRNSELRAAVQRILEELLGKIGFDSPPYCPDGRSHNHDHAELNSFASHVRLCAVSPMRWESSEITMKEVIGVDLETTLDQPD
ncbi:hypothetical protein LSTR_LSTR003937 [Laodelphax striatellus]|uniref:G-protein coupled receptors family 1 profile domain-containing protein n=1 Tax=Laodelphax striatellus TaxID=195883 RepID=A0A482X9H5_LAOST|nr:hypothetical protein LSTR_LSTR003937 [Laodelphax striatellus]